MAALPGRPEEDGIAMLQAGTATAAYLATRLIMMAIACFQVLMTSQEKMSTIGHKKKRSRRVQ
jgi:hypothetical protein